MRYLLLLIMISLSLWGKSSDFWNNLEELKNKYSPETTKFYDVYYLYEEDLIEDDNDTSRHRIINSDLLIKGGGFELKSEELKAFSSVFISIKNEPYHLIDSNSTFFNDKVLKTEIFSLESRIKRNNTQDNHKAVLRDELKLKDLKIQRRVSKFLNYLGKNVHSLDIKKLEKILAKERKFISNIQMKNFSHQIDGLTESSNLEDAIVINYINLLESYIFYKHMIIYLDDHMLLMEYKSYLSIFNLDYLINEINEHTSLAKINYYLNYVYSDFGRIVLFLSIVLISILLRNLLSLLVFPSFKSLLKSDKLNTQETKIQYFNKIKRLLSSIFIVFGVEMAVEVLIYPNEMNIWLANLFFLIFAVLFTKIGLFMLDVSLDTFIRVKYVDKDRAFRKELVHLIVPILKTLIIIIALVVILSRLDVDFTAIIASLGIGGLAVALAAKDTIASFFASIQVILDDTFSQGDWIETSVGEGNVVKIGLGNTTVRTFDNAMITIPNTLLADEAIKNWSRRRVGRRIKMSIGITYGSKREDVKSAIEQIKEMLVAHPQISTSSSDTDNPRISKFVSLEDEYGVKKTLLVFMDNFSESSIDILVYCFTKSTVWSDWLAVKEDVMFKIWEILDSNNLEMAFPSHSIYIENDEAIGSGVN